MRASVTKLLAALLAIGLVTPAAAPAASGELKPKAGDSWQADQAFAFDWDPVPPADPTAVVLRIYNFHRALVAEHRLLLGPVLPDVLVPPIPDAYTLEAWMENESGQSGPHSTAILRFDNAPPPVPALALPTGWVGGTDIVVHLGRPAGAAPLSGIGGYAISVDRNDEIHPCSQPDLCLAGDLDLTGGGGGNVSLSTLSQGIHFVRAVAVSGSGVPSAVVTAAIRVDAGEPLVSLGVPTGWSSRPVQVAAHSTDALSGMTASGPLGPFTAIAVDGGAPARALGGTASTWVAGSGSHQVEYFARDAAGNLSDTRTSVARIDEEAPRVAFAATQDPSEPERIEATVSDLLSGPSPDRGSIAIRLAGTRGRFQGLPTRNAGDRLIAHWDSDSYPPGKYELVATGYDAAGNSAAGTDRARGGRIVLVNPLKAQVELTAGLAGRRFAGRLRRAGAGPLAGREVIVTETFAAGAMPRRRTTVLGSDRDGAFALRLRPGPSRDVVARFAGTPLLSRAASRGAQLEAATRIQLQSSTPTARVGGKPVVFSGTVGRRGTANAVAGLPIELQFRFRGGAWSEFRTVEADAHGRFRYRYRFSDDDSRGIRFQFRAHAKGREGWPYGPGTSRPVQVKGV